MAVVCLDTQILIWGIKKEASPNQETMIVKASHLIRSLEEQKANVIIPSLVLAELLMPIEEERYGDFLSLMNRSFMIAPFDTKAAFCYGKLWRSWRERNSHIKEKGSTPTRSKMKTDFMIVATAMSREAECIYSKDSDIIKFAKGNIDVRDLPPVFHQGMLV